MVSWFLEVGNQEYPWRQTTDPYAILVSEIMLQQTQISTVLDRGYFINWLQLFPDVNELAAASEDAILKAWEGLGYYRRARNLKKAAQAVVDRHDGEFPQTHAEILALPGVGDYTAGAVASFAYNLPAPLVDANVARVFTRLFDSSVSIDSTAGKKQLWQWAADLVDPDQAREYNSGLMELGQKICRPTRPKCEQCPVAELCVTREPETLPVKKQRVEIEEVEEYALFLRDGDRIYLTQEAEGNRREGLWRLPLRSQSEVQGRDELLRTKYGITRYRVTMLVYRGAAQDMAADGEGAWVKLSELADVAMASPYRKALNRLLELEDELDFLSH